MQVEGRARPSIRIGVIAVDQTRGRAVHATISEQLKQEILKQQPSVEKGR